VKRTYLLLSLLGTIAAGCTSPQSPSAPITVRVAVLNFDPVVGDSTLHQHLNWASPTALADEYVANINDISHGQVAMNIVSWRDVDAFPIKTDGFEYSLREFQACWNDRSTCHQPDGIDYLRMVEDYDIAQGIDQDTFDELWIFGAPYMGFWESSMAGPGAFYINGGVFPEVGTSEPFVIMGFSYERGLAEMLHNLCHRTEATMEKVSGGWDTTDLSTDWARFAANAHQSNGISAVGSCHYPANGTSDYDYDNLSTVLSNAEGWMTYPEIGTAQDSINAETWGGPNYQLNYMKWWFRHLPHSSELSSEGMLNSWWDYVFNFKKNVISTSEILP